MKFSQRTFSAFCILPVIAIDLSFHPAIAETFMPDDKRIGYRGAAYPQFGKGNVELLRFSPQLLSEAKPQTHGFNPEKARSTSGGSIVFSTDSPTVKLHFDEEKSWDYAVYQNGEFSSPGQAKSGKPIKIKSSNPGSVVKYRIVMPNFRNPVFKGLETNGDHKLHDLPATPGKIYAALGDSITHGRGQKISHETWPWQVAELLDMELYNVAVGGSNANAHQPIAIADLPKVDLVTILWGYNDWVNRGKTITEYNHDMNVAIKVIRTKHPEVPIAILKLLQTRSTTSKRSGDQFTADDFRNAATSIVQTLQDSGDKNIHLIASDKMTDTEEDLSDPVHLSTKGATKLAKSVAPELKLILTTQN